MTNPTNPSPPVVRLEIAKRLGWTGLIFGREHQLLGVSPRDRVKWGVKAALTTVPNWPGSLDAARGLKPYGWADFAEIFAHMIAPGWVESPGESAETGWSVIGMMLAASPIQWCLAWILSEHGYRWDDKKEEFIHV